MTSGVAFNPHEVKGEILTPELSIPNFSEGVRPGKLVKSIQQDISSLGPRLYTRRWLVTGIYLPITAAVGVTGAKAKEMFNVTIAASVRLKRNNIVVWESAQDATQELRGPGAEVGYVTGFHASDDFTNPIEFDPNSRLQLELQLTGFTQLVEPEIGGWTSGFIEGSLLEGVIRYTIPRPE